MVAGGEAGDTSFSSRSAAAGGEGRGGAAEGGLDQVQVQCLPRSWRPTAAAAAAVIAADRLHLIYTGFTPDLHRIYTYVHLSRRQAVIPAERLQEQMARLCGVRVGRTSRIRVPDLHQIYTRFTSDIHLICT